MESLGGEPDRIQLFGAEALALLLFPACLAVGFVTAFSPALCRFLRTGAAPPRGRARHIRYVPRPGSDGDALRTYRLFAADAGAGVAAEIRRCLTDVGIEEADDGRRDIVVLTDRTPAAWPGRDHLRDPLAVVATSIVLPVRGAVQHFQWTDYRRRRRRTLQMLARATSPPPPDPMRGSGLHRTCPNSSSSAGCRPAS